MAARLLKDPATAGSRIFVGHLQTEEMTRNELEDHFSKYGTVVGSILNRGFGFVQFENEQAAQDAIKSENGSLFKGRRIDVKPAKKDSTGSGNNTMGGGFGSDNFSNSFGGGNQGFNNSNSSFGNNDNQFNRGGGGNNLFNDDGDSFGGRNNDSFGSNKGNGSPFGSNRGPSNQGMNRNQNNQGGPNQMGGSNQMSGPNQMGGPGNRSRGTRGGKNRKNRDGSIGDRMGGGMDDRGGDHSFGDRMGGGMGGGIGGGIGDRIGGGGGIGDSLGSSLGSSFRSSLGGGMGSSLGGPLGSSLGSGLGGGIGSSSISSGLGLSGNSSGGFGSSFRDRSPLGRSGRLDDKPLSNWELNKPGSGSSAGPGGPNISSGPGGPSGRGGFGSFSDHKSRFDDFKGPASLRDPAPGFGPPSGAPTDYPSIAAEKNDCEIIVVNKALTEYAEIIESRLKKLGLTVDLLFPNEDVPLTRVLGNIASRGCLYAIVIAPTNKEHHSLTLNILHGLPQEHRNMPVDDAINLVMRDFNNYKSGGRSVPTNAVAAHDRHPDAIQVLLNMLADNLQLTVLQYERVIKYLEMRREEQVQFELGEDAKNLGPTSLVSDPKQAELQSRILNILNSNKNTSSTTSTTTVITAAPSPVPPPAVSTNVSGNSSVTTSAVTPSPLLNDPTVQKALDSLLQGNLLKNIGDQPTPTTSAAPLFAAFPNINRF